MELSVEGHWCFAFLCEVSQGRFEPPARDKAPRLPRLWPFDSPHFRLQSDAASLSLRLKCFLTVALSHCGCACRLKRECTSCLCQHCKGFPLIQHDIQDSFLPRLSLTRFSAQSLNVKTPSTLLQAWKSFCQGFHSQNWTQNRSRLETPLDFTLMPAARWDTSTFFSFFTIPRPIKHFS